MKIHLHAGAHKTATTYIQSALAANIDSLNRQGVGYLKLPALRHQFTAQLMQVAPDQLRSVFTAENFFRKEPAQDIKGLLVSDENVAGGCADFVKTGQLYRNVEDRFRRLREVLAGAEITLFFSIRSYDTFIPSAYVERARNAPVFTPFPKFRARIDMDASRWPLILSRMTKALEPDRVVVWRYEDFAAHADAILRKLAFGTEVTREALTSISQRASFSQMAVDVLHTVSRRHGPKVAGAVVKAVSESLPKGSDWPAFDPWGEEERQRLCRLYQEDQTELSALLLDFGSDGRQPAPAAGTTSRRRVSKVRSVAD